MKNRYLLIGKLIEQFQILESILSLNYCDEKDLSMLNTKEINNFLKYAKGTLGYKINKFKTNKFSVDDNFNNILEYFLKQRNYIAHEYFIEMENTPREINDLEKLLKDIKIFNKILSRPFKK